MSELGSLTDAVASAASGVPAAVLVRGEPGIGKTRAVEEAWRAAAGQGFAALWGRCVRFGEVSLPCLPLVGAFEGWLASAPAEEREAVLAAVPGLRAVLPSLGAVATETAPEALLVSIDRAVAVLAAARPVVLVVDDVQWADTTSRDVLAYLLSGLRDQPVLVLLTCRDERLAEGDPFAGWLADVVRLPAVRELRLGPLGTDETREQLALLLGGPPDPELVGQVQDRTGGNPYFTELLAAAVAPESGRLPAEIPQGLQAALSTAWGQMSSAARELARWVAVAGRPTTLTVLGQVAAGTGGSGELRAALREAVSADVARLEGDRVWLHHPLLADVLTGTLLPEEQAERHRAFAEVLENTVGDDAGELAALAAHYEAAGMCDEAFQTCLIAADAAAGMRAFAEESALRVQAARLYPRVSPKVREHYGSLVTVYQEAAWHARRNGDAEEALELLELARAGFEQEPDPVVKARALRRYMRVARDVIGPRVDTVAVLEEARALSEAAGAEHAHVLADLAEETQRLGHGDGIDLADEAVAVARASGDRRALCYVLCTRSRVQVWSPNGERDVAEANRLVRPEDPPEVRLPITINFANVLDHQRGFAASAEVYGSAWYAPGMEQGRGMKQLTGAYLARYLLELGRCDEADQVLRQVLSMRASRWAGRWARQFAVVLCVRQGRLQEADAHLERLRELAPDFEFQTGFEGVGVLSEYQLAHGRPEDALSLITKRVEEEALGDPLFADKWLVLAARAAGDLAERSPADHVAGSSELTKIVEQREAVEPAFAHVATNLTVASWKATFQAEASRCEHDLGRPELWHEAVARAQTAKLRYDECRCRLGLARCLLSRRKEREVAAEQLRTAHRFAVDMGTVPLRQTAEDLARGARISLEEPVEPPPGKSGLLTSREREVLAHLSAGRTNAEIARSLYISEKTVSVHVTNLLHKTGTRNRLEAVDWARRHPD